MQFGSNLAAGCGVCGGRDGAAGAKRLVALLCSNAADSVPGCFCCYSDGCACTDGELHVQAVLLYAGDNGEERFF